MATASHIHHVCNFALLRKAVAAVNRRLDALGLEKHPDKTFIGRIEKGFDFLGYHFAGSRWGPEGLTVAKATVEKFVERVTRLYEQEPGEPAGSHRLGMYVQRWGRWVRAGLVGRGHEVSGPLPVPSGG